ncbi:MAG: C25 family cysteine peptidase [Bacteroidota bacterium]
MLYTAIFVLTSIAPSWGQMWNGQDSLYGNEWINFDQSYYKIMLAEDGIYRLTRAELEAAGVPTDAIDNNRYQLFYLGSEVPMYLGETNTQLDYIEFYGRKNRSEIDRYLYTDPDAQLLHPMYSLFTDTSAYFLTWSDREGQRYTTAETSFDNLPAPEVTFNYEQQRLYTSKWHKQNGLNNALDYSSLYSKIEGYAQPLQNNQQLSLRPEQLARDEDEVNIDMQVLFANGVHSFRITVDGVVQEENTLASNYQVRNYNFDVSNANANTDINVLLESTASEFDRHALSHVTLRYPRNFDFENDSQAKFRIDGSDRKFLQINNFNHGGTAVLYDVTSGMRIPTRIQNNTVQAVLPTTTATSRTFVLINDNSGARTDAGIRPQRFVDYRDQAAEFLILTHPALYDDGNGENMVQAYADYRSSVAGGGYEVTVAEIQQIYDQFAYGINRHNIAVQNFANYLKREWSDWRYALLLGKSFTYDDTRSTEDLADIRGEYYLPTYGSPGSDVAMFSSARRITPHVGVGRIPATNGREISIYLNKLKSFEDQHLNAPQTLEARGGMHRAMHLGGGITASEQNRIKSSLETMEGVLENNQFGAEVTSFFKTSSDAIQVNQSAALTELINNGVTLLTFFGHSSANTFDFSLDSPENYDNQDRYPVISSYGCYAGQIHQSGRSIGERFIFAEERGAIGFIASVSQAYIRDLSTYGLNFFSALGNQNYGSSVSDLQRITTQQILGDSPINEDRTMHQLLMQTTFQGDPALKLSYAETPDYLPSTASVTIEPELINSKIVDTITLSFDLFNIGKNEPKSVDLLIEQELPSGERVTHINESVSMLQFRRSFLYELPMLGDESIGLNRIHISIDDKDVVTELPTPAGELNNKLVDGNGEQGIEFLIFSNDARPLYPNPFGVVQDRNLTLKAATTNTLAPEQRYIFELDTTENFNSSAKIRTVIEQGGGVLKWQPNIDYQEGEVYYWRVSPDSTALFGFVWQNSSFIFLENEGNGFNQSHYYQQTRSEYEAIELTANRKLEFGKVPVTYRLKNGVNSFFQTGLFDQSTNIVSRTTSAIIGGPATGVMILVFDGETGELWTNEPTEIIQDEDRDCNSLLMLGSYESQLNSNNIGNHKGFKFLTTRQSDRLRIIKFLDEEIPEGSYVAFYTIQSPRNPSFPCYSYFPERWAADSIATGGLNIFNILEREGARQVRGLQQNPDGNTPYIFAYRKGDPSKEDVERVGEDTESSQTFFFADFTVESIATKGKVRTPLIGPATDWKQLEWKVVGKDNDQDKAQLNIYGYDAEKRPSLIFSGLELESSTLNSVDAAEFPFLQLEYETEDAVARTPQQLDYWRVFFDGTPEAVLNKSAAFLAVKDTLQQGEPLEFMIAAENVSDYDMDSLLVQYNITDAANNEVVITERVAPLISNDTVQLRLKYDTQNLSGAQTLRIEINANNDQAELIRINNVGFLPFYVQQDERNPLLDVVFDGVRIMNGDIVSPDPIILMTLDDENDYLRLSDTSLFEIMVRYPDNSERQLSFDRNADILRFVPASANANNRATVEYSPIFEEDGIYQLVVSAQDATGNKSAATDYSIEFRVELEDAISNVFNYPNPFTTATHFVYTLTGHVPTYFSIDIMTVSGRVVRQLTQDEIGALKVGTHQTEYAWDGTDEYGDQLANGVYLYRVVIKDDNQVDYNKRTDGSSTDFFKNNIGKMVLIR